MQSVLGREVVEGVVRLAIHDETADGSQMLGLLLLVEESERLPLFPRLPRSRVGRSSPWHGWFLASS